MKLNDANKIFVGATPVSKVFAGSNLVWQAGPSYPAVMNTAAAWFDATQDAFTDGQTISSYTSHSAGGRVFTVPVDRASPVFRSNVGGKPRIQIIVNAGMQSAADYQPPATGITYVMVNRRMSNAQYGMMWVYNSGGDGYEMRYEATNTRVQLVGDYVQGGPVASCSIDETLTQDYLHYSEFMPGAPGRTRCWINGTLGLDTGMAAVMTRPASNLWIGCRSDGYPADIMVAEGLVFGGILSDADRIAVTDYLMTKWSITSVVASTLPGIPGYPSEEWMP